MKIAKLFLYVLVGGLVVYVLATFYFSYRMAESHKRTWESMKSEPFPCPEGTEEKTEGWSKLGVSRTCSEARHGKWEAWSEGYKQIDGYYDHGKKNGKWVWYRSDGSISKSVEYNQGDEVSSETYEVQ